MEHLYISEYLGSLIKFPFTGYEVCTFSFLLHSWLWSWRSNNQPSLDGWLWKRLYSRNRDFFKSWICFYIETCSWTFVSENFWVGTFWTGLGIKWKVDGRCSTLCATLYVVAKINVHGTNKSESVCYLHAFELSTLYQEILVCNSQDCGNAEQPVLQDQVVTFALQLWIFQFCPILPLFFLLYFAYKRTSIQPKKSEIQPASLSSGNTSSSLLCKWFLDWNCWNFLQTSLAPDFSSLVSISSCLEWRTPAVCQC